MLILPGRWPMVTRIPVINCKWEKTWRRNRCRGCAARCLAIHERHAVLSVQMWICVHAMPLARMWDRSAAVRMTAAVNSITFKNRNCGSKVLYRF